MNLGDTPFDRLRAGSRPPPEGLTPLDSRDRLHISRQSIGNVPQIQNRSSPLQQVFGEAGVCALFPVLPSGTGVSQPPVEGS